MPKSIGQVRSEGPDLLHLLRQSRLLKALAHEERLIAAPDQRRKAPLHHQSGRADITERLFTALHEGAETAALQDEMGSDLGRDDLNPRRRKLLENFDHIL